MIARLGKSLEAAVRRIRPYLRPASRRAYRALVARGLRERREGEPIVCCDFRNPAIDAVGGRYYFSLVRDLIDAGYFVVFSARRVTLSSFGTSPMKSLLLHERLGVVASPDELTEPYFLITDDDGPPPAGVVRLVVASHAWRTCQHPGELSFPLFVHPRTACTSTLPHPYDPSAVRPARLFFGGNTVEGKYDQHSIHKLYGMLTRREVLETACSAMPAAQIHRPADAAQWLASPDFHRFVFCETQHCKIPQDRWIEALAKADFFLACPGVGMPLCHNLIEAMAAGCVPVLQYAAYLPPPLTDGLNCLVFQDAASLSALISRILTMPHENIVALRAGVADYYKQFLAPGRFAQRLFDGPPARRTMLLNAYRVPRG